MIFLTRKHFLQFGFAIALTTLLSTTPCCASTGFGYPTATFNPPTPGAIGGFGGDWGKDKDGNQLLHNGVDVDKRDTTSPPVRAIAAGRVKYAGSFGAGWGSVVMIEHVGTDGVTYVAVYGHITINNAIGSIQWGGDPQHPKDLQLGDTIGWIDPNMYGPGGTSCPHLHFGLFKGFFSSFPSRGWGSMLASSFPGNWVNPSLYLGNVATPDPNNIWLDFGFSGSHIGTQNQPFNDIVTATNALNSGGTLHIRPGSSTWIGTISKPMTLVPEGGPVTIGR